MSRNFFTCIRHEIYAIAALGHHVGREPSWFLIASPSFLLSLDCCARQKRPWQPFPTGGRATRAHGYFELQNRYRSGRWWFIPAIRQAPNPKPVDWATDTLGLEQISSPRGEPRRSSIINYDMSFVGWPSLAHMKGFFPLPTSDGCFARLSPASCQRSHVMRRNAKVC
ncbi:hypothetical protein BDN67DRAFT_478248 [Paxillus ammoniavirescens]|nr:hypothetical protein BDN67DRAFT_478248 [Paxillus ammoniavirescens]